ncbi:MAG TPA: hypothetical protein PKZ57_02545 [Methanoregulaceae archaeon]|nr:hypothetical protein [Methanoregulaceae archaeon]
MIPDSRKKHKPLLSAGVLFLLAGMLILSGCTTQPAGTPAATPMTTAMPSTPTQVDVKIATTAPTTTISKPSSTASSAKFSFTEYVELVEGKYEHGIILKNDGSVPITGASLKWTENGNKRSYGGSASIAPGEQVKIPLPPYYLANDNPEKLGFIVTAR